MSSPLLNFSPVNLPLVETLAVLCAILCSLPLPVSCLSSHLLAVCREGCSLAAVGHSLKDASVFESMLVIVTLEAKGQIF